LIALTPDETILGLLAAQARHGYQLLEIFNDPQHLGKVWNLSTSQLYAVLKRLERYGWIFGEQVASENAPTRNEYLVTQAGLAQLDRWLNDEQPAASIRRVRVEFLSRVYIAQLLHRPVLPIINYQRRTCQQERERLLQEQATLSGGVGLLASEFVVAQMDTLLKWLDHCEIEISGRNT
jgi:PadR family transcriptional regulator, regulatory protein AphA